MSPGLLDAVRISDVWQALGGDPPQHGRARAWLRAAAAVCSYGAAAEDPREVVSAIRAIARDASRLVEG